MIQKIKSILLTLSVVFLFAVPVALPAVASAAADVQNSVCNGATNLDLTQATSGNECKTNATDTTSSFQGVLTKIINIFSIIVGVIAVIMIIFGGFRYITSGGQQEGVKNAKNTILYALIGLVIVALAQIIVKFVLNKATG